MTNPTSSIDDQSIVSLLTPSGRGAVATIYYRGDLKNIDLNFKAANEKNITNQNIQQIIFGHWDDEDIVVCRTSENELEIHCHAGMSAVNRILGQLEELGCKKLAWEELRKQTLPPFEAELEIALTKTFTLKTAAILQRQQKTFPETIQNLINSLTDNSNLHKTECLKKIKAILKWEKLGQHLTEPWKIVLTGRPNVGKSSLMNALMGYDRSIVFDQPGTTRDVVKERTAFDGWMIELSDTAGIRKNHAGEIEETGIKLALKQLKNADCQLVLLDRSVVPSVEDFPMVKQCPDAILIANKCDLDDAWKDQLPKNAILVSAITGEGLKNLTKLISQRIIPEVPSDAAAIPFTERQADLLKQAFEFLGEDKADNAVAVLRELV